MRSSTSTREWASGGIGSWRDRSVSLSGGNVAGAAAAGGSAAAAAPTWTSGSNVIGGVRQFGDLGQPTVGIAPKLQHADGVRLANQRDLLFAIAEKIRNAGRIEPAVRRAERRRLGDDLVSVLAPADHRKARTQPQRRLHHDDLVPAVAVEVDEARREVLEYGVGAELYGLAAAVAALDRQRAGLELVAESTVIVTVGRLGQPGTGDVAGADGDAAVGQGAFGMLGLRRLVEKRERGSGLAEAQPVPEAAGVNLDRVADGLDGVHARRRGDFLGPPFHRLRRGSDQRGEDGEQRKTHTKFLTATRGAA